MDYKKIMATLAVAGIAAVAGADVTSSVVGYQSAELQQYGLTAGACFVPVTGNTFDLTDLKVTGYDTSTEGDLQIQTLDYAGRTVATYYYYDLPGEFIGWFDENDVQVEVGDVTFQPGEGLWAYSTIEGLGLQSAGMVPTAGISVTLQQYGLSVANPTPIDVDLTDTYIGGYDTSTEGDVQVQTLDYAGRTVATYYYYDLPGEFIGWFDENDVQVEVGDVVIKPGQGLWTYSNDDGFTFVFPGVAL